MTLARARRALRETRHRLYDPNVTLIDFGHGKVGGETVESKLAIRFHVRRKLSPLALESAVGLGLTRAVPPAIDGFETDVIEASYRPQRGWWSSLTRRASDSRAVRVDPMRGGISISDERHQAYGTLGGLVADRVTGAPMILSNWHVLAADWRARAGQRIYQPGRLDGGTSADAIASLTRDAMSDGLDAAVATLHAGRRLTCEQLGLGALRGVARAELGMELAKSGRRTGVTFGVVRGVEGAARMTYGSVERVIRKVVSIEPRRPAEEVSASGDSGSLWLERASSRAVGLHFAGGNFPETGLALDIREVLDRLDVDLVVGEE
jgi:endonuclease G